MNGRPWSEDDEIYLEYFIFNNDAPLKEAAKFLNRTEKAVAIKLWKMRRKNQNIGRMTRLWTEKELLFLQKNNSYMTPKDIGIRLGRTESAVKVKACELGLRKNKDLSQFDNEIREMAANGYYTIQIAKRLRLNRCSVYQYLKRNNIPYKIMPENERENGFRRQIKQHCKLTTEMKAKGA